MTEAFSAAASIEVTTQARLPPSIRTAGQSRPFIRSNGLLIILLASPARFAAREKRAGVSTPFSIGSPESSASHEMRRPWSAAISVREATRGPPPGRLDVSLGTAVSVDRCSEVLF